MSNDGTDAPQLASSVDDIASALGVNRRTVYEWLRSGAPGKDSSGRYDIDEIAAWRDVHRPAATKTEDMSVLEYRRKKADAELYEAKAKREMHRVLVETEDVVHLDNVDAFISQMFTELRRLLHRVPKEMSAGYADDVRHEIEKDLNDRLDLALRALHGYCTRVVELRDGD